MFRNGLLILTFGIAVTTASAALAMPFGGPPLPHPGIGALPHAGLGGLPRLGAGGPPRFAGPGFPGARTMGLRGGDRGFRGNFRGFRGYGTGRSYGRHYGYARGAWKRGIGDYAYGSESFESSGCYYASKYSSKQKTYKRVLVCSGSKYGRS
jgi:hypothetical protein